MVNTEEFIERLQRIISHYQLSASAFADQIGVQRSSISHLLSGRNKPSLDFVMRVVRTYPDVNLYWLLNGKGSFPPKASEDQLGAIPQPPPAEEKTLAHAPEESDPAPSPVPSRSQKAISRIIIFYEDGSFESYSKNLMPDT